MELESKCPLCGRSTNVVVTTRLRRGTGIVFYCTICDHGFLALGKVVDAKEYYAKEYRREVSHIASGEATNARELFDVYSRYQDERLRIVSPYLSPSKTLLEVGASAGQFLMHVKNKVARVGAIELDGACCDFMRERLGIEADSEFLRESRFANERYDIVCSFQVLEHIESPISFLRDLKLSMKENGVAFVEVPNLRDPLLTVWDIESYKSFYYHSAHLQYFTENSLRKAAVEAGFESGRITVHFSQDYNLLNHLNWVMNGTPQPTCDIGLSPVHITGHNPEIAGWLDERMTKLNAEYITKLVEAKATSNLMMVLSLV